MAKSDGRSKSIKSIYTIGLALYFSLANQVTTAQPAPAPSETLEERVNRRLARMDGNGDGIVTRAEFRASIIRQNPDKTPQQVDDNMHWLFPRFDIDGDGVISRADLVQFEVREGRNRR